ncbi:MAG: Nif3-like dinuclear metal center hexameric protein, partial [Deltaproteobacteria bacterium]|nr:Nif3-like dinuclear metal center hexameric protein [Deltaproteobacteria bacterium]
MNKKVVTAADVVEALDVITGGRVIRKAKDVLATGHPFVITKSSNIPGKAVTETPGLVCGDPDQVIRKLAVSMTLTESQIELAGATGVNAVVAHHPVADAASCGGVLLRGYVGLYGLAVFEVHEAFHGRHPGIGLIHGHRPFRIEIAYGGLPGNVMFVGRALPGVKTAGDIILRLATL